MSNAIQPVRVLPMSNEDEGFAGITSEQIQDSFFLRELPKTGIYHFKEHGLQAARGTSVLFQFESHVIASAILDDRKTYRVPAEDGFKGELHFDPSSIRVFEPVGADTMRTIWKEFGTFGNAMIKLDVERYAEFQARIKNVRSPFSALKADEADPENRTDGYRADDEDQRPVIERQIRARRGQQQFRDGLLVRFNGACLVTGCTITDILEAAHIHPHRGANDNHLENGLLLRSDIHTLFDLYLLSIEPEKLQIEVHPKLRSDLEYWQLDGKPLRCTSETRPSTRELQLRYNTFRRLLAAP